MKTLKGSSTLRGALLLAFTGVVSNSGAVLASDQPYDAQAQVQAVLGGTLQHNFAPGHERSSPVDSRDSASTLDFQALVRQFLVGVPGIEASQKQAAPLNATTLTDGRRYADAQRQVQRTLGGAG
jgi:hypothetical protein